MTKYTAKHLAKRGGGPLCLLLALAVLITAFNHADPRRQSRGHSHLSGPGRARPDGLQRRLGVCLRRQGRRFRRRRPAGIRLRRADLLLLFRCGRFGKLHGGVSSQVRVNCVFSGDIDELYGIPRIHGLVLTMTDGDPEYPYYHIGIYVGNNMATDNSTWVVNMVYDKVVGSGRGWSAWHVFDNGTLYPSNGWYEFNGALYHYTNCQYDVDQVVDGFTIGSDGIALDSAGNPLTADSPEAPALSQEYVSASTVADALAALGYSGEDTVPEEDDEEEEAPTQAELNGVVTGNDVNVRVEPNTTSWAVATLSKDDQVKIVEAVTGQTINDDGSTTDQWYSIVTASGKKGYVCSLYVAAAPAFSVVDGSLVITALDGADIRYTSDGTQPTAESTPYNRSHFPFRHLPGHLCPRRTSQRRSLYYLRGQQLVHRLHQPGLVLQPGGPGGGSGPVQRPGQRVRSL